MPSFHDQKLLPYTAQQLFAMVADIDSYQVFLPWCKQSKVTRREGSLLFADLAVSFKGFSSVYTSEVSLVPPEGNKPGHIRAVAIRGPFKTLHSSWFFSPDPKGCLVDFQVEFSFQSGLLDTMLRGVFTKAQEKLLAAFLERAQVLYGISK